MITFFQYFTKLELMKTMKTSERSETPVTCNLDCGRDCPLIAHVHKGKIEKIFKFSLIGFTEISLKIINHLFISYYVIMLEELLKLL